MKRLTRRDRLVTLADRVAEAYQLTGDIFGFVPDGDRRAIRLMDTLFDAIVELERLAGPPPGRSTRRRTAIRTARSPRTPA